ncbi:MAG: UDP-N-acetylglucosamine 2-epimerase (non-hydrolyzing) [Nitrospinae bacterium]|nr:UDP-N-acetylglucosamine 2-epimerase (non-hydrolyzing) [Nitrospinota bacterium]
MKILNIVGARPNFIKIAPLMAEMNRVKGFDPVLLHTGQHYDEHMSRIFFDQLEIPQPDYNLEVGSGTNSEQVGEIIKRFDPVIQQVRPDALLVVGDVNSTVACALVASYHSIPVIHVEAGLRSFDRSMPEEINRILTDQISDLLFVTEKVGVDNLINEGIDSRKIHLVGDVMVDSLLRHKDFSDRTSTILDSLGLEPRQYAVLTLHRPSNVDQAQTLESILTGISELSKELRVVFPIHPRTKKMIREFKLDHFLESMTLLEPQPYLDMIRLMSQSRMVLTDSGGIQEETTILDVPCLTIRENTERPVTIEEGTNSLVGTNGSNILKVAKSILELGRQRKKRSDLWDGKAAERICRILLDGNL